MKRRESEAGEAEAARAEVFSQLLGSGGDDSAATTTALADETAALGLLIKALGASPGAVLLMDGLDEAESGGRNKVLELLLAVGEQTADTRVLALCRPDDVVKRRLKLAFKGGLQVLAPADVLPAADGQQRVLKVVLSGLRERHPKAAAQGGLRLDAAYAAWFSAAAHRAAHWLAR